MKRTRVLLALAIVTPALLVAFQNCAGGFSAMDQLAIDGTSSGPFTGANGNGGVPGNFTITSDPTLKAQSVAILSAKCASCHDTAAMGNVTQILDENHLVASGLVVAGDPTQGRLVGSIADGTMPTAGTAVTATELTTIKNWIASMSLTGPPPPPSATPGPIIPAGMTVASDPTLKTQSLRVLQYDCAGCHQADAEGGIDKIMNVDKLVSTGLVVMKDPSKGRLLGAINDLTMPVSGTHLTVSSTDKQTLQNWILSMTLTAIDPMNPPNDGMPILEAKFASIQANILIPKCVMCHGASRSDGGIRYDTYTNTMRTVSANNSANSKFYNVCRNGSMPDRPFKTLSSGELSAIKSWIDGGAQNN